MLPIFILLIHLFPCQPVDAPAPASFIHEYHISHTKMEYADEQKEWQISIHVFIDDLEKALQQNGHEKLHLGLKREVANADTFIIEYIEQRLKLKDKEGQIIHYQWLGKEMTDDFMAFWIYLYVQDSSPKHFTQVENQLLTDLFDDQQNIVDIRFSSTQNQQFLFNKDYWKSAIGVED